MNTAAQKTAQVNLRKLKPYGDIMDDGTIQLSFTLPVEASPEAREAAQMLVQKMGFDQIKIATMEPVGTGFSFFVVYANVRHTVDFTRIKVIKVDAEKRSRDEIDEIIQKRIGRKLKVVGACTGFDAHTVGIDAIINMKGFAGDYGLERYTWVDARNLGAQVSNDELLKQAQDQGADAILVSKVVTQHNIHLKDMKDLMRRAEELGLRDRFIFVAGGPRITHPMALECGFDAGFGVGTKPSDVASYVVDEFLRRQEKPAPVKSKVAGTARSVADQPKSKTRKKVVKAVARVIRKAAKRAVSKKAAKKPGKRK